MLLINRMRAMNMGMMSSMKRRKNEMHIKTGVIRYSAHGRDEELHKLTVSNRWGNSAHNKSNLKRTNMAPFYRIFRHYFYGWHTSEKRVQKEL